MQTVLMVYRKKEWLNEHHRVVLLLWFWTLSISLSETLHLFEPASLIPFIRLSFIHCLTVLTVTPNNNAVSLILYIFSTISPFLHCNTFTSKCQQFFTYHNIFYFADMKQFQTPLNLVLKSSVCRQKCPCTPLKRVRSIIIPLSLKPPKYPLKLPL